MFLLTGETKIDGKIKCITGDHEHGRILYIISEIEQRESERSGKKTAKLWGYTQGALYDLTPAVSGVVKADTKVIPYFSPAENT